MVSLMWSPLVLEGQEGARLLREEGLHPTLPRDSWCCGTAAFPLAVSEETSHPS